MRRNAHFEVIGMRPSAVTIRDIGPHDRFMTVTNDAESVVSELVQAGILKAGQRLLYYDSEGELDEIFVKDGRFAGFGPGPGR